MNAAPKTHDSSTTVRMSRAQIRRALAECRRAAHDTIPAPPPAPDEGDEGRPAA